MKIVLSPLLGFYLILVIVIIIAISVASPLIIWACLELNILAFLPIISSEPGLALENTMKYFLVQRWASIFFLIGLIFSMFISEHLYSIRLVSLILKLGAAPFHGWFISIVKRRSIWILTLLSTLQKCTPLIMIIRLKVTISIISLFMGMTLIFSYFSLPRTINVNKILALSSIVNLSWLLVRVQHSLKTFLVFFFIYSSLLLAVVTICTKYKLTSFKGVNNFRLIDNLIMVFVFMSLGGLPPLLGFLGKLLILKSVLVYINYSIALILVYSSLLLLYTYISRLFFIISNSPRLKIGPRNTKIRFKISILCSSLVGFNMLIIIPI